MSFEMIVQFGESKSKNYSESLSIAKKFHHFIPIGADNGFNVIVIDDEEIKHRYYQLEALNFIIGNWKSTKFIVNGNQTRFTTIKQDLEVVINCSKRYKQKAIKDYHCSFYYIDKGWGCILLREIKKSFSPNEYDYERFPYWFHFGYFIKDRVWKIDKELLKEALKNEAEYHLLDICEHFDFSKAEQYVDKLPDYIDVNITNDWKIKCDLVPVGSGIIEKPVGVRPLIRKYEQILITTHKEIDTIKMIE